MQHLIRRSRMSHFPLLKLLLAGQYENLREDKKILVFILFQRKLLSKRKCQPILLPQIPWNCVMESQLCSLGKATATLHTSWPPSHLLG